MSASGIRAGMTPGDRDDPAAGDWPIPASWPALAPGAIHVWRAYLVGDQRRRAEWAAALSLEDRSRFSRFRSPRAREQSIASRGQLRQLIGRYLDRAPSDVALVASRLGKPALAEDGGLRFNASHSGDLALYAFAIGCEVGIDVQQTARLDLDGLAGGGFFCASEIDELRKLTGRRRQAALACGWTRKEALLKALGLGMQAPLAEIQVSTDPKRPVLIRAPEDLGPIDRWRLMDLAPGPGYAGCLAWASEAAPICWTLS